MPSQPEAWLRGPIDGVPPLLMPAAHALVQALEDLTTLLPGLSRDELWAARGGASIGFHARHLAGSLDRLFTYARGEALSEQQRATLMDEKNPGSQDGAALLADVRATIDRALDQLRSTDASTLLDPRGVGRSALPSNVLGLLFHAAEHTTRHVGQIVTTAKLLR